MYSIKEVLKVRAYSLILHFKYKEKLLFLPCIIKFYIWDLKLNIKNLNQQNCSLGTSRKGCHSFAESDHKIFCDQSRCLHSTNDQVIILNWRDPSNHISTFSQAAAQPVLTKKQKRLIYSVILTKDQQINPHAHLSKTDGLIKFSSLNNSNKRA